MPTQPEALRLADELERDKWHVPAVVMQAAADELRRLHASCEDYAQHKQRQDQRIQTLYAQRDALLEALKGLVAWADDLRRDDPVEDLRKARAAINAVEGENHAKSL